MHATVLGENVVQILGTTLKAIPQSEDPPSCDVNIFGKETVSEDLQKFRKIATKVKGLDVKIKPQHIEDFAAISDMQPITAFKRVEYLRMDTSQLTFGSREMFHDAAVRGTRSVLASLAELKKLHLHQGPRELAQRKQTGIVDCLALLPKLNDVEFESCSSVVVCLISHPALLFVCPIPDHSFIRTCFWHCSVLYIVECCLHVILTDTCTYITS